MDIKIKRAYEEPTEDDGTRILVDRLWPRGLTKVKAKIDLWLKDVAPSTELRKWFAHDPTRWTEFQGALQRGTQAERRTACAPEATSGQRSGYARLRGPRSGA